jgi:PST family polysaccharide transporter
LAPAGFFLSLYTVVGAVLMGLGRSDLQFRLALVCGLAMLIGVAVGARFGLEAAAAGVTIGAAAASPFYATTLSRQLGDRWTRVLSNLAWPLTASAVMVLAVLLVRHEVAGGTRVVQLLVSVLTGAAVYTAVLAATSRRQIVDDLQHILPGKAPAHPALERPATLQGSAGRGGRQLQSGQQGRGENPRRR